MERRIGHSRIGVVLLIVGSVFLVTAGAAFAANSAGGALVAEGASPAASAGSGALAATGAISGTQPVTGGKMIAGCIATFFQVDISDVVTLRSEGYGFGELAIAFALAEEISPTLENGLTAQDILELRQVDNMGWGQIAHFYDLSPGNSERNLGRIVSGRVTVSGTETLSGTVSAGAQRLAARLGAAPEEVAALLDQGAGYGAVAVAYKLASQYEGLVTAQELIEQRLAGASWGQIKRELKASVATTLQSGPASQGGKPEHTGRPDHAGKPDHAGPKESHGKGPKK